MSFLSVTYGRQVAIRDKQEKRFWHTDQKHFVYNLRELSYFS